MNADEERAYDTGARLAWTRMLQECLCQLDYEGTPDAQVHWILEREAALACLREICRAHGDNDWPDTLHLPDILEKHLWKHLG